MPKTEDRFTSCAAGSASSNGRKARVNVTVAVKLIANSQSNSSAVSCWNMPMRPTPALFTSKLTRPWLAATAPGSACAAALSATSMTCSVTATLLPRASMATAARPAASRSTSARAQCRRARSRARARPIPPAAPVMTATLLSIGKMVLPAILPALAQEAAPSNSGF